MASLAMSTFTSEVGLLNRRACGQHQEVVLKGNETGVCVASVTIGIGHTFKHIFMHVTHTFMHVTHGS
jgi:hypothetical protein